MLVAGDTAFAGCTENVSVSDDCGPRLPAHGIEMCSFQWDLCITIETGILTYPS